MQANRSTQEGGRRSAWLLFSAGIVMVVASVVLRQSGDPISVSVDGHEFTVQGGLAAGAFASLAAAVVLVTLLNSSLLAKYALGREGRRVVAIVSLSILGLLVAQHCYMAPGPRRFVPISQESGRPATPMKEVEQAIIEVGTLESVLGAYYAMHKTWPLPSVPGVDTVIEADRHKAVVDLVVGSFHPGTFTRVFIGMRTNAYENGILKDPWGKPYHIVVDTNADGVIETEVFGTIRGRSVLVWSDGPGRLRLF